MTRYGLFLVGLWFDRQKYYADGLSKETKEKICRFLTLQAGGSLSILRGGMPEFTPPISMRGSEFRKAVWEILLPYHMVKR